MFEGRLRAELSARLSRLRPAHVVMQPAMMGAARLTRYSFSRTMLRRASRDGWKARRVRPEINHWTRSVIDEVRSGGVIGCTLYPLFMGGADVGRQEYCAMIARLATQVGVEHVAIGTDAVLGWQDDGLGWMRSGRWDRPADASAVPDFPEWPAWFRGPSDFASLAAGIDDAGCPRQTRSRQPRSRRAMAASHRPRSS